MQGEENTVETELSTTSEPPATVAPTTVSPTGIDTDLIITGIFDGPESGTPKVIELYATGDIPNLSIYGLGLANNGGGSNGVEFDLFPEENIKAGEFIYVVEGTGDFEDYFGEDIPFHESYGILTTDGNDALELFKGETAVDVFGDINVNGRDTEWDYSGGWAYSKSARAASTAFDPAEWTYSGPDALLPGEIGFYQDLIF